MAINLRAAHFLEWNSWWCYVEQLPFSINWYFT